MALTIKKSWYDKLVPLSSEADRAYDEYFKKEL